MATPKKLPSGRWRCLVYVGKDENGKRKYRSVTADTKKESIAQAAQLENRPQNASKMTVGEAVRHYIDIRENVLSPATVRGYEKILRCNLPPLVNETASKLTRNDIQQFVTGLSYSVGGKTIENILSLLRPSLRDLVAPAIFDVNRPQKVPVEITIPSQATAEELAEAVYGLEIELPVLLAMQCGLRMSEVLGIEKEDADFAARTLRIRRAIVKGMQGDTEKGAKSFKGYRTIPMPPRIAELLAEADEGHVIKLSAAAITHRFHRLMDKRHMQHIRFHDLRHYYASIMLSMNMPGGYAMDFMGHSSPGMLKKYQHIMDKEREIWSDKLSEFFDENATRNATQKPKNPDISQ